MTPTIPRTFRRLRDNAYPFAERHIAHDPSAYAEVFVEPAPARQGDDVVELAEQPDKDGVLRYQRRTRTQAEIDAEQQAEAATAAARTRWRTWLDARGPVRVAGRLMGTQRMRSLGR